MPNDDKVKRTQLKKGEFALITAGEYSSYSVMSIVEALVDVDLSEQYRLFPWPSGHYRNSDPFVEKLVADGLVRDIGNFSDFNVDYGE